MKIGEATSQISFGVRADWTGKEMNFVAEKKAHFVVVEDKQKQKQKESSRVEREGEREGESGVCVWWCKITVVAP